MYNIPCQGSLLFLSPCVASRCSMYTCSRPGLELLAKGLGVVCVAHQCPRARAASNRHRVRSGPTSRVLLYVSPPPGWSRVDQAGPIRPASLRVWNEAEQAEPL